MGRSSAGHLGEGGRHGGGALGAAVDLGGQAPGVHGGDDAAGGGDGDLVARGGEGPVGSHGLLGPVAGRVPGAVRQRPVVRAGQYEQDLRHLTSLRWASLLLTSSNLNRRVIRIQ